MAGLFPSFGNKKSASGKKASPAAEVLPPGAKPTLTVQASDNTSIALINNQIYIQEAGKEAYPLLQGQELAIAISDDAKCHIARKIARLLPELAGVKKLELLEFTENVLKALCRDQLVRVRRILAEELKDYADAPHDLISTLAWDTEITVAGPVLQCSPVLTDQDLIEIVTASNIPGVAEAIAGRKRLSSKLSHAIVRSRSIPAITSLLKNEGAEISAKSYKRILHDAPDVEAWHEALVARPDLPLATINKLATFVSTPLIHTLARTHNLSDETRETLLREVNRRLTNPKEEREKSAETRLKELQARGALNSEAIEHAVIAKDRAFVQKALAVLSGIPEAAVQRMLESGNAKAITALCWKAGVSMRVCMEIQKRLALIHHTKMILARRGVDYPLTPEEMSVYLDIFQ